MVTDHPLVDSHNSAAGIEECLKGELEGVLLPPYKRDEELPLVAGEHDVSAWVLWVSCGMFACV